MTDSLDLRAAFGFHSAAFTREIRPEDHLTLPFLDEAHAGLLRAVEARMSCALIAPAGAGKTQLVRRLLASLPEARYDVHYVKVTDLSKRDMCREIAMACRAQAAGSYPMLVRRLQERFETTASDGRRPVLVLDESHDLRPEVLRMLRLLTNFDMDSRLVVSVVLAGQGSLKEMLTREENQDVARRIVHYAKLRLLTREETINYITHRCFVAGAPQVPFDEQALNAVFEIGRGNLRATDLLAFKALEHAALAAHTTVATQHVVAARKDLWP